MVILSNHFIVATMQCVSIIILTVLVIQSQYCYSGFISIDCGISDGSSYTDETTGIVYSSDSNFTTSGENRGVAPEYQLQTKVEQFHNVRSFPVGIRNCYSLKPSQGNDTRYLVRARFMYGNYDNKNQIPEFELYLGVDLWDTISLDLASTVVSKEIILAPSSQSIEVCLVNTGYGVPFISALEIRPLGSKVYASQTGTALRLFQRYDFGSTSKELAGNRYKVDIFDRIWFPYPIDTTWTTLTNSLSDKNAMGRSDYEVPRPVLDTAYTTSTTTAGGDNLVFNWKPQNSTAQYYFYMHFAELQDLNSNQSRNFNIYINGDLWSPGPILLDQNFYLRMVSVFTRPTDEQLIKPDSQGTLSVWINRTENSTLPPIINAMEIFIVKDISQKTPVDIDVGAIVNIKSAYGIKRNWQGDPCAPKAYLWDGLNCSLGANYLLRIISLDLSASGLKGGIIQDIANLKMLQLLDLSNNSLHGKVPEFLGQLPSLRVLNIQGNNLTGPIPEALLRRLKNGLSMSFDKNLKQCPMDSTLCGKKKNKKVIPAVGSVVVFVILLAALTVLIWWRKRRSQVNMKEPDIGKGSIYSKKKQFKYSEIKRITNNFERVLGEGGFGKVYHGNLNGTEVAVKTLSSSSIQGHRQFHAELKLLLTVHHKNLTSLVGFCNERTNIALIYEYMAMGNLRSHLSVRSTHILGWEDRLRIAIDTAQGLEYLHSGCKPPIIHRDVKSTNILLTEKLQAKLGDFGLSKIFPNEGYSDQNLASDELGVSTVVAGTPGYLDPEYYVSNWLNEKSDVYSFGVVLLEIISGQPVLTRTRDHVHIVQWVGSLVEKGDIKKVIDQRIQEDYDVNIAWKAVEIAMACVASSSRERPTMNRVVMDLKDCLSTVSSTRKDVSAEEIVSKDFSSAEMIPGNTILELSPQAR